MMMDGKTKEHRKRGASLAARAFLVVGLAMLVAGCLRSAPATEPQMDSLINNVTAIDWSRVMMNPVNYRSQNVTIYPSALASNVITVRFDCVAGDARGRYELSFPGHDITPTAVMAVPCGSTYMNVTYVSGDELKDVQTLTVPKLSIVTHRAKEGIKISMVTEIRYTTRAHMHPLDFLSNVCPNLAAPEVEFPVWAYYYPFVRMFLNDDCTYEIEPDGAALAEDGMNWVLTRNDSRIASPHIRPNSVDFWKKRAILKVLQSEDSELGNMKLKPLVPFGDYGIGDPNCTIRVFGMDGSTFMANCSDIRANNTPTLSVFRPEAQDNWIANLTEKHFNNPLGYIVVEKAGNWEVSYGPVLRNEGITYLIMLNTVMNTTYVFVNNSVGWIYIKDKNGQWWKVN